MTVCGKAESTDEALVEVSDLDVFVTMMFSEDSLAVLSLGFICAALMNGKRKSHHCQSKMERLSGPSLGTMCQLWQFPKNFVYWTSQARHRVTDCESQVPRKQETSRRRFQKGSTFRRRPLWCTPRLTQCRGGTTCGRAHRKNT